MTCPKCSMPLIVAQGREMCGRCDTPRPPSPSDEPTKRRELAQRAAPPSLEINRAMEAKAIDLCRGSALRALAEVDELLALAQQHRLGGMVRDPAKAATEVAKVYGILTDKMLLLEGRPTQITESRDLEDYAKILQQLAPQAVKVVDSTAEEA